MVPARAGEAQYRLFRFSYSRCGARPLEIVDRVLDLLGAMPDASLVASFADALQEIEYESLLVYKLFQGSSGRGPFDGPDVEALAVPPGIAEASQRQRKEVGAKYTLPQLIEDGISPVAHVARASQLDHPFAGETRLEADQEFALETSARWGPYAGVWRNRQWKVLCKSRRAARPRRVG